MRIQIDVERPRWLRRPATWKGRIAVLGVALLTVAVPVAWASHDFADVPTSHQFHSQISAIKGAGITTGCGGGNYCPDELVRRDAMAAFMHRGYGRVAESFFGGVAVPLDYITAGAVDTVDITTGVAAGSPGNGFIKADAAVEITRADAVGCPCTYLADLGLDFASFITDGPSLRFTITAAGSYTFPLTGAIPAGQGNHTVEVLVQGPAGATASGYVTATYFPFGPTGTNGGVTSLARGAGTTRPRP